MVGGQEGLTVSTIPRADAIEGLAQWLSHENPLIMITPQDDDLVKIMVRGADCWAEYVLMPVTMQQVFTRMEEIAAGDGRAAA